MIYKTSAEWREARHRKVLLFGMSGLGKTHVSNLLRDQGDWFHYSVDYRIGTRYMGEHIADNFKREAMKVPLLRELLMTDSVYIASNITFDNLAPLSTYLGKPGDPAKGGVPFEEYLRRQEEHRQAEIAALLDTPYFADRAIDLYGYAHFVCDTSGSICEVVEPDDPQDAVLNRLEDTLLLIWIKGDESHRDELIRRFDRAPKPIYYRPDFLRTLWTEYCGQADAPPEKVDPDAFLRFGYARLLAHRQPLYEAMARRGITLRAEDVAKVTKGADFVDLVARVLESHGHGA